MWSAELCKIIMLSHLIACIWAETCIDFVEPKLKLNCVPRAVENSTCVARLGDQGCGLGVKMVEFENCKSQAVDCCKPCSRKVMHRLDCPSDYCVHGRLLPGSSYKTSKHCQYTAGVWGNCDAEILMRKRKDKLITSVSSKRCEPANEIDKVCSPSEISETGDAQSKSTQQPRLKTMSLFTRKEVISASLPRCSYTTISTWSSCHPTTRKRTLIRKVEADSPAHCTKIRTEIRPCFSKNGKERCFYTKWTRWGKCENYIQRRTREILYGRKENCKRTVKIRTCRPDDKSQRHRRHKTKKASRANLLSSLTHSDKSKQKSKNRFSRLN